MEESDIFRLVKVREFEKFKLKCICKNKQDEFIL